MWRSDPATRFPPSSQGSVIFHRHHIEKSIHQLWPILRLCPQYRLITAADSAISAAEYPQPTSQICRCQSSGRLRCQSRILSPDVVRLFPSFAVHRRLRSLPTPASR